MYYNSKPVPYTVGPIAEVQLSHRFGSEGSVLYQRCHYTYWGQLINTFSPGVANVWSKTTSNAWSFPILVNWHPLRRHPLYFGTGPVIRNLRGLDQVVDYESTYSLGGPITTKTAGIETSNPPDLRKRWYPGLEVSAGWHFQFSVTYVSPEIRYTRWTANIAEGQRPLQFPANRIEVLVGINHRILAR